MTEHYDRLIGPDSPLRPLLEIGGNKSSADVLNLINQVEHQLKALGLPTTRYSVGTSPSLHSYTKRANFPEQGYLENGGLTRRLIDSPVVADAIVYIKIQKMREKFHEIMQNSLYYRPSHHRQDRSINEAKHKQAATLGSYVIRTFCDPRSPAVVPVGFIQGHVREKTQERKRIIESLPIDPDRISDAVLIKAGLAPPDYLNQTKSSRRRVKATVAGDFLALLSEAKSISRGRSGKRTGRIISFLGADGQEKIGVFSTVTDVQTQVTKSKSGMQNRHHKIYDTDFHVFGSREEARKGQEHAIDKMTEQVALCGRLYIDLKIYAGIQPSKKVSYLKKVVTQAQIEFEKKESYYTKLVLRYLQGSQEGKPTLSVLERPSLIGLLYLRLEQAMSDLKGKIDEMTLVKNQL